MIELRTLGALALRAPTGEDFHQVLAQPKRVALLVYLATARPRGFHRRDTLHALLWPEQDERHARWALNQALRHLRSALGKEVLPSRGDGEVGVDPQALSCDAVEFEVAIAADNLARALELYRGDLLEGFHVSGCGEFERWLEEERVWLRRRAAQAAAALARRGEAQDEPMAAAHWARRAFALAPEDEGEIRNLIGLLDRIGDRAGAVQMYQEFARRLRVEYEVEPAPETLAAIEAVRTRQPATVTSPAPLVIRPPVDAGEIAPQAVEPTRSRRRLLPALGLLALMTVAIGIWTLRPPPTLPDQYPVSRTTIAVLPFAYRGSPEFDYLAQGMVDLLSANLDGAGELQTVDPEAMLAQTRHAGGEELAPGQARDLAAQLGAGSYVLGNVVETGGRLRISARLRSGARQDELEPALVEGPSTGLFELVDGLTAQLIARHSGGPAAALSRLAAITTDSLAALKAYLDAERHYRAWRPDSSIPALQRAVRIDSSFALAHYRMATALLWTGRADAGAAVDRALRHGHRLSDRDRRLIEALAATLRGRIAEAERIYREIVTRYPDDLEATLQLGDLILNWSGLLGRSWLDSREQFARVLSIDPGHHAANRALSMIAARERRLEELDSLTDRVLRMVPTPGWFYGGEPGWFYRGQRAVAFGDTAETARFMAELRAAGDGIAQPAGGAVIYSTGDLVTGRRIWRLFTEPDRARGVRVLAHLTLAKMELMSGRWRAAKVELDSAGMLDPATALEHRALLSLWPLLRVSRAELVALRDSLRRWKAAPGPFNEVSVTAEHAPAHPYLRLYLLGLLSARLGDHGQALEHAAELERRAAASFAPAFVNALGRGVRVDVTRARGRTEEALAILDSSGFWTPDHFRIANNSPFYSREYDQFIRAELLLALGREEEALRAYRGIADQLFHSGAPAHLRMAEIYERQGEEGKAVAHYARFAELWKDCDTELRLVVAEARRRMVR